jgi:ATP-binding cassette subfamily B protein
MVSFERVFEVLDLPVEIEEAPDAVDLGRVAGRIEFRDVWFDYEAAEREGRVAHLETVARFGRGADSSVLLKRGRQATTDESPRPRRPTRRARRRRLWRMRRRTASPRSSGRRRRTAAGRCRT